MLASLTTKAKKHEIRDRCRMFLNAENVGHDFSSCELVLKPVIMELEPNSFFIYLTYYFALLTY